MLELRAFFGCRKVNSEISWKIPNHLTGEVGPGVEERMGGPGKFVSVRVVDTSPQYGAQYIRHQSTHYNSLFNNLI